MFKHLRLRLTADFDTALQEYPQCFTEMYQRMLVRIPKHYVKIAQDMLRWIMVALRPLQLKELSLALSIRESDSNEASGRRPDFSEDDVSEVLGAFVKVENGTVSTDHQSAREFFLRDSKGRVFLGESRSSDARQEEKLNRDTVISMHNKAAETCRKYLLFDQFDFASIEKIESHLQTVETLLKKHEFLQYASSSVAAHYRRLSESLQVRDLFIRLLKAEDAQFVLWLRLCFLPNTKDVVQTRGWTALHSCAYFDLELTIGSILSLEEFLKAQKFGKWEIDVPDSASFPPLHIAVSRFNKEIVKI